MNKIKHGEQDGLSPDVSKTNLSSDFTRDKMDMNLISLYGRKKIDCHILALELISFQAFFI